MASSFPAVPGARPSADGEQGHHEDEGLARLDAGAGPPADGGQAHHEAEGPARLIAAAGPALAVAEVRRDRQLAAAADLHPGDALVPAADDHAGAEPERERLAAVPGGVELATGR